MTQRWAVPENDIPIVAPYRARCAGEGRDARSGDARLWVRALSGDDELAIGDAFAAQRPAVEIASMLIGACVADADGPIGADAADALSFGDREVLLRAIYAATFLPVIEARIPCRAGCGETIEFALDLRALDETPPEPGPVHRIRIGRRVISCRVPTGADLRRSLRQPGGAVDFIARACSDGKLPAGDGLARALARLDPNAECELAVPCPLCGAISRIWLDAFELIRRAVAGTGGIMLQIDRIARAYGWSEAAILALPPDRRRRYCALAAAGDTP